MVRSPTDRGGFAHITNAHLVEALCSKYGKPILVRSERGNHKTMWKISSTVIKLDVTDLPSGESAMITYQFADAEDNL